MNAKLLRAYQHAERFRAVVNEFFGDPDKYDLVFAFDNEAREVDILGAFQAEPPLAYLGAVFGDIISCDRAALDHIVWGLSVRHQPDPPPRDPIPWSSPWRRVGFPVVTNGDLWNDALATKLALVDPKLHARFRDLQPFVTDPIAPHEAWLAKLDSLWNIDKHRVIHVANLTIHLELLRVTRHADGFTLRHDMISKPQRIDLHAFDAQTHLARLRIYDDWPRDPDEVEVERGFRINVFLEPGPPGFGHNMDVAQSEMHNAVVRAAVAFEQEFT